MQDFIPAPANSGSKQASTAGTAPPPVTGNEPIHPAAMDTTRLVIAAALLLVLAVGLFFVRAGIKSSLVNSRSSIDAANFAGTVWYVFLLLLSAAVVFGVTGGFFHLFAYTAGTIGLAIIGLIICGVITGNARKTRK